LPGVQVGKVYMVSKARVQPKRAAFNNTNSEYEITLERNSTVQVRPRPRPQTYLLRDPSDRPPGMPCAS
jgi:ssDNA-binding replication factor A large subunit